MPTIRRCCIVGCLSNSRQNQQLQFFQFPKPENPFHKLWKQACHASLSRILPFKKPVVCALHFHPNCIGGRRLTSSAVPSVRMEVPSNLKAVEQQAMMEEIERSRKCAYINAVVYEWLVRANLNPQLRGSITHGMIKEKADTAKHLIGSSNFTADNRWLNRFRETHLNGFATKLATNQLKPLGPSLWVPDIVQDLQHLFPPTSADRMADLEAMPDHYMDYMQQYGEYEEDESMEQSEQSYQEQQQNHYHQQQQQQQQGYNSYSQPNYNYDDFYYERQNQQNDSYASPQQRPLSHSPPQQQSLSSRTSPFENSNNAKRLKLEDVDEVIKRSTNGTPHEIVEDLTDGPDVHEVITSTPIIKSKSNTPTIELKTNGNDNGNTTPNGRSSSASPKSTNGQTNGHSTPTSIGKELDTYAQALEYLKPLEDFALFKENFRAIGLLSQLEVLLRKGERAGAPKWEE